MTDAQSFYLLLAAFYLYECLIFAPNGAWAFVGRGGVKWRRRAPLFQLSGLHKEAFCSPVIPFPGFQLVFPVVPDSLPKAGGLRRFKKQCVLLGKITIHLRICSLVVFLHYFLLLPLVYRHIVGSPAMIAIIIQGELLAFYTAFSFNRLHKRLFPEDKWERFLETLYTAFLPWHAMRSSDLIIKKRSADWHPLAALASHPDSPANQKQLARIWREARLAGDTAALEGFLNEAGIDPTPWDQPPELENPSQKYCPVCLDLYEEEAETCADCKGVALLRPRE
jgi:hypothetical protein